VHHRMIMRSASFRYSADPVDVSTLSGPWLHRPKPDLCGP
jgi:hypothetical protein